MEPLNTLYFPERFNNLIKSIPPSSGRWVAQHNAPNLMCYTFNKDIAMAEDKTCKSRCSNIYENKD